MVTPASFSPKPKDILSHIELLKTIEELHLSEGLGFSIHQNRFMKFARGCCDYLKFELARVH